MLINILQSNWKVIAGLAFLGLALSLGWSLAQEPVYVGESRMLVRYMQTGGVDAYAASRAAGKVGQMLAQVAETDFFLEQALKTQYGTGIPVPQAQAVERRKFWQQAIEVSVGIDSSIITVRSYAGTSQAAQSIVQAVTRVFMTQGEEFHGADGLVSLRQVDTPAVEKRVIPYLVRDSLIGLVLGILVGLGIGFLMMVFSPQKKASREIEPIRVEPSQSQEEARNAVQEKEREREEQLVSVIQEERPALRIEAERTDKIHTIFDDIIRLGLDLNRLTVSG